MTIMLNQILPFLGPAPPVIPLANTHQVKGGAPIEGEACQLCPQNLAYFNMLKL